MSREKARRMFQRRIDMLADAFENEPERIIYIPARQWGWFKDLCRHDGDTARYRGFKIEVLDHG